jgi:hypothetical protein
VLLAACGGSDDGPAAGSEPADQRAGGTRATSSRPLSHKEQLDRLLAARAAALEAGDVAAYGATATGRQRVRDGVAARRAARLGLRDVALIERGARVRGAQARLRVALAYGYRGVPARFVAERRLRARRTAAGWRVAAVIGGREPPPWEVARFHRVRADHVLLLAPPAVDPAPLEAAYRAMAARLPGRRLPRRVLVVAAADAGQAEELTATIEGVRTLAAAARARRRCGGAARGLVNRAPGRAPFGSAPGLVSCAPAEHPFGSAGW